ncbi:MAG TPA: peptidoglycan binding domain-containing protein, partial [Candidatus Paceibacterota bacterium]|nr:peptidoglycan binding domain-containing protein [Candidatus Paceibacterota bacterium]
MQLIINVSRNIATYIIIILAVFGIVGFEYKYQDKFYPGVYVDGKSVGGKTYEEVLSEYKKGADVLYKDGITLVFEGQNDSREVNIPMVVSGMSSYGVVEYFSLGGWENTIKEAYDYGRNGSALTKAKEQTSSLFSKKTFDFPAVFQNEAVRSFFSRELKDHFIESVPAEFSYVGGNIVVSKESAGEGVNFDAVAEEINKKLSSFDPSPIILKSEKIEPEFTKEQLEMFLPVAKKISRGINLYFKYNGYGWRVSGRKLVTWLKLDNEGRLSLDRIKAEAFLSKNIIPVLDNKPLSSRFKMKDGILVETEPGKPGNMVDVEGTIAKVEEVIFGKKRSLGLADSSLASLGALAVGNSDIVLEDGYIIVPIDLKVEQPRVTKDTLGQYEIRELVGTATTNFKGSS